MHISILGWIVIVIIGLILIWAFTHKSSNEECNDTTCQPTRPIPAIVTPAPTKKVVKKVIKTTKKVSKKTK